MVDGDGDGTARSRWSGRTRIIVTLMSVFVAASAAAVAVPMVRGAVGPSGTTSPVGVSAAPAPSHNAVAVICVRLRDDDYCDRYSRDVIRRLPLSEAQRADAESVRRRLIDVLPRGRDGTPSCDAPQTVGPDGVRPEIVCAVDLVPPGADEVRRALTAAGYTQAVVRQARADDPAPIGSVLVAVAVGPACILVHIHRASTQGVVGGRLPDGRCLA